MFEKRNEKDLKKSMDDFSSEDQEMAQEAFIESVKSINPDVRRLMEIEMADKSVNKLLEILPDSAKDIKDSIELRGLRAISLYKAAFFRVLAEASSGGNGIGSEEDRIVKTLAQTYAYFMSILELSGMIAVKDGLPPKARGEAIAKMKGIVESLNALLGSDVFE